VFFEKTIKTKLFFNPEPFVMNQIQRPNKTTDCPNPNAMRARTSICHRYQMAAFEQIRQRAFEICRERGSAETPEVLDWLLAERELNARCYSPLADGGSARSRKGVAPWLTL
jgi:hypothetical protein